MNAKDAEIIKALAELGVDQTPEHLPAELIKIQKRLDDFEREMGGELNPELLAKYLG